MFMLNGSYDIVTGKSSNINQNIHYLKLINRDKLTFKDKLNLRQYIVKNKLPVTLDKKSY